MNEFSEDLDFLHLTTRLLDEPLSARIDNNSAGTTRNVLNVTLTSLVPASVIATLVMAAPRIVKMGDFTN